MKFIVEQSWIGDWEAYDEDGLSGICGDPDCGCRRQFIRGTGDAPEEAIQEFVNALLDKYNIEMEEEEFAGEDSGLPPAFEPEDLIEPEV